MTKPHTSGNESSVECYWCHKLAAEIQPEPSLSGRMIAKCRACGLIFPVEIDRFS